MKINIKNNKFGRTLLLSLFVLIFSSILLTQLGLGQETNETIFENTSYDNFSENVSVIANETNETVQIDNNTNTTENNSLVDTIQIGDETFVKLYVNETNNSESANSEQNTYTQIPETLNTVNQTNATINETNISLNTSNITALEKLYEIIPLFVMSSETYGLENVTLFSSSGKNISIDSVHLDYNFSGSYPSNTSVSVDWRINGSSIAVVNMPFSTNISNLSPKVVMDYSSYQNNGSLGSGTASTSPKWVENGKVGGAYYFDGGDYIFVNNSNSVNITNNELTMSVWINPGNVAQAWTRIMGKHYWAGSSTTAYLLLFGDTNNTVCEIDTSSGAVSVNAGPNSLTNAIWQHIVCTYDGTSLKLYINGELKSETSHSGTLDNLNYPFTIGTSSNGTLFQNRFLGYIDEVLVLNKSISANQIQEMYQAGLNNETFNIFDSSEVHENEQWSVAITPTNLTEDGLTIFSNNLSINPDTTISSCGATIENYSINYLNQSIFTTEGNCLNLTNLNNVILDCNNYEIIGPNSSNGIYILDNSINISITNCNISYFENGLYIDTSSYVSINKINLYKNFRGAYLTNSNYNILNNSNSFNNTHGLVLFSSDNNNVTKIKIYNNTGYGINSTSSNSVMFQGISNERDYNETNIKFYSNTDFSGGEIYNIGHWPLLSDTGSGATSSSNIAWYSGSYSGRNPDGSENRTLRYYPSLINISDDPNPGYSDVLLIVSSRSNDSLEVSKYFIEQRGIEHVVEVYLPGGRNPIKFTEFVEQIVNPIKLYLNDSNATINYLVTTMGIPIRTDETMYPPSSWYNASSIDSELALVGSQNETYMGYLGNIPNPYSNSSAFMDGLYPDGFSGAYPVFSRELYDMFLVTRLDGFTVDDVKGLIDRSANINKQARDSGNALLMDTSGYFGWEVREANKTLINLGLNVTINDSSSSNPSAVIPNIPYYNVSYVEFYQYNSFDPNGLPNISWINGGIAGPRFSWAGKEVDESYAGNVNALGADLIRMGATMVHADSEEPFTSGSYYGEVLAHNFAHGHYYADIMWNAIPHLSYAATIFADPKACYPFADIQVYPESISPGNNISCEITLHHPPSRALNISYEWYKNGVNQTDLYGEYNNVPTERNLLISNLTGGNISFNDTWHCRINIDLFGVYSNSINSSSEKALPNCDGNITQSYTFLKNTSCYESDGYHIQGNNLIINASNFYFFGNSSRQDTGLILNGTNISLVDFNIDGFYTGIKIVEGSLININNNNLYVNKTCMHIVNSSLANITLNNLDECKTGIQSETETHNNLFYYNNIFATTYWVNDSGENWYNYTNGNFYTYSDNYDLIDLDSNGFADSGTSYPFNSSTGEGRWIGNGSDYSPALYQHAVLGCMTIDIPNSEYRLLFNLTDINTNSGETCILISAPNVVLDCRNHEMSFVNTTIGIKAENVDNTTVKNCVIKRPSYGVYFYYSDNNTIENLTINSSFLSIYYTYSSNNIASDIYINNSYFGIYYGSSHNNNLTNVYSQNSKYGVYTSTANYNTMSNLTIKNSSDFAFRLYDSQYNNFSNMIVNTAGNGTFVYYSQNNTFTNITLNNSVYGVYLTSANANTYNNLTIINSTNTGIYGLYYNNDLHVFNAQFIDNNIGFYGYPGYRPYFENISFRNSTTYDLQFSRLTSYGGSSYCLIKSINFTGTGGKTYMYVRDNNTVIENVKLSGLDLCYVKNATIRNVSVFGTPDNKVNGIFLYNSDNITIINTTSRNNQNSFYSLNSENVSVYNNFFGQSAARDNFYTLYSDNSTFNVSNYSSINIVNGNKIGGNYYFFENGSINCTNLDDDSFCDNYINVSNEYADYLPLYYNDTDAPVVSLISPTNNAESESFAHTFTCNARDIISLKNISLIIWYSDGDYLYSNSTTFTHNETYYTWFDYDFSVTYDLPDYDSYVWNCIAYDDQNLSSTASSNFTITIQEPEDNEGGGGGPSGNPSLGNLEASVKDETSISNNNYNNYQEEGSNELDNIAIGMRNLVLEKDTTNQIYIDLYNKGELSIADVLLVVEIYSEQGTFIESIDGGLISLEGKERLGKLVEWKANLMSGTYKAKIILRLEDNEKYETKIFYLGTPNIYAEQVYVENFNKNGVSVVKIQLINGWLKEMKDVSISFDLMTKRKNIIFSSEKKTIDLPAFENNSVLFDINTESLKSGTYLMVVNSNYNERTTSQLFDFELNDEELIIGRHKQVTIAKDIEENMPLLIVIFACLIITAFRAHKVIEKIKEKKRENELVNQKRN